MVSAPSGIPTGGADCSYSYAVINTNQNGESVIEFSTLPNTNVQLYTIRVERNESPDKITGSRVSVNIKDAKA